MKMKYLLTFLLALYFHQSTAQYVWPVATAPALSANFGELRSNHYHMGLDARTEQRENLKVLAAEEGYISRIKIEPWGFGRAIYIDHPNGVTSLYAHLNDFYPALEKWVTDQQYAKEQWALDIMVPKDLFKVTKGQFIAYSGNSGGSMGPHLHFELRDTKTEVVLNPLKHGFSVPDRIAPDIIRLALYDRCVSTYEQSPKMIPLRRTGNTYSATTPQVVVNTDKISFAITSYDKYSGSTNQNGIYSARLFENDRLISSFRMDSISYDDTRYLNAHIDYRTKLSGGPYLQHLSKLPGDEQSIYRTDGDGVIILGDEPKDIRIEVSDPEGNTATIRLKIKASNILKSPLASGIQMFHPGFINVFENEEVKFYLPEKSLYDSFRFVYNRITSPDGLHTYQLHKAIVPVHGYFPVSIKANIPMEDSSKVIMKRWYGSRKDFKKAVFGNGWYTARFREFGNYQLIVDKKPPVISAISKNASRIYFTIVDETEELQNFRAELDGKWLRFSNDKGRAFIYKFDERCPPGSHTLKIYVEDLAGNVSEKTFNFTR